MVIIKLCLLLNACENIYYNVISGDYILVVAERHRVGKHQLADNAVMSSAIAINIHI